jgi:hypothetical protein
VKRLSRSVVAFGLAVSVAFGLVSCTGADDPPKQAYEVGYCGEPATAYGGVSGKEEDLVRFSATKLASWVGGEVRSIKVAFFKDPGNPAAHDFEIELYAGGTAGLPGNKLFDKVVSLRQGWNDIPLDAAVAIDGDTELWAGYSVDRKGCWPVTIDDGINVPDVNYCKYEDSDEYFPQYRHNTCVRLGVWK